MVRLLVAVGALGAALAGLPLGAASAGSPPRPNIVVLMTDDQTLEEMRVLRRVDRWIGRRGVTFENAFVSLSLCCPSRATFLTGQYAHNHGIRTNAHPTGGHYALDHANTLPAWLQRRGYATVLLGKYLNEYGMRDPREVPPGWTEWHATVDPSTYWFYDYTVNHDGVLTRFGTDPEHYQTDVLARRGAAIVRRRAARRAPFFLWMTFLAPHAGSPARPGDPPGDLRMWTPDPAPRHNDAFRHEGLPPGAYDEPDVSDKPVHIRQLPRIDARVRAAIVEGRQQRLESLLAVDEAVGRVMRALRDSGELRRTAVLFTSDNGFLHGEHRIPYGKIWPYEPALRVPLLMRGPRVPAGRRRRQLVANVDLAPTILDLAGARAGRPQDGRSLVPLARDGRKEWGRDILVEAPGVNTFNGIRTSRYMYTEYPRSERELYDLHADPEQRASLHAAPWTAPLQEALRRRLSALKACRGRSCRAAPRVELRLERQSRPRRACARRRLVATVDGADVAEVERVQLERGRRIVRSDRRPPYEMRLRRGALGRGSRRRVRLRARVTLRDDRTVTLDRRVRRCR